MAEQFATEVIVANGGKVAGHAYYPFPATTDFSGFLLQAQASGAKVISVGSGTDAVNTIKQAVEFGLPQSGVRLTSGVMGIEVVDTLGLATARGIVATEPFYWDLNDRTRAFSNRFAAVWNQRKPTMIQAGTYSAAVHYLKAVASLGLPAAKASGRAVAERMKALPRRRRRVRPRHRAGRRQVSAPDVCVRDQDARAVPRNGGITIACCGRSLRTRRSSRCRRPARSCMLDLVPATDGSVRVSVRRY